MSVHEVIRKYMVAGGLFVACIAIVLHAAGAEIPWWWAPMWAALCAGAAHDARPRYDH
jgi:hypothetical protein